MSEEGFILELEVGDLGQEWTTSAFGFKSPSVHHGMENSIFYGRFYARNDGCRMLVRIFETAVGRGEKVIVVSIVERKEALGVTEMAEHVEHRPNRSPLHQLGQA